MRRKKHKHTRKSMAFYKVNYGFREPYKVCWGVVWAALCPWLPCALCPCNSKHQHQHSPDPTQPNTTRQVLLDGNFLHATLAAK